MTARLPLAIAAIAFLTGCVDKTPAPRVNELLHQKQLAQDSGYVAYKDLDWKAAARNFEKAADILNALDDLAGEAALRHNQARALQHGGQLDAAIVAYERARDLNQRLKLATNVAVNLTGLAQCYQAQGKLEDAIKNATKALPMVPTNAPTIRLIIQNDLASFLIQRNNPGDIAKARELLVATDSKAAITQLNLGRAALADGQHAAACDYLKQALKGFCAEENAAGIASTHEQLMRCYEKLGDRENAKFHHDQAFQKYTRLQNAEALKRIARTKP
jgi:tetratricopeptide (TPR) repeat protein